MKVTVIKDEFYPCYALSLDMEDWGRPSSCTDRFLQDYREVEDKFNVMQDKLYIMYCKAGEE